MTNRAHVTHQVVLAWFAQFETMAETVRRSIANQISQVLTALTPSGIVWSDHETASALTAVLTATRMTHRGHRFPEAYCMKRFRANIIALKEIVPEAIPVELRGLAWGPQLDHDSMGRKARALAFKVKAEYDKAHTKAPAAAEAPAQAKPKAAGKRARDMAALVQRVEALEAAVVAQAKRITALEAEPKGTVVLSALDAHVKGNPGDHQALHTIQGLYGECTRRLTAVEDKLNIHPVKAPATLPIEVPRAGPAIAPLAGGR